MERDRAKRKVKPPTAQTLLVNFEDLGESSDDSDFRIEDHCEESDDYSMDSGKENSGRSGAESGDEESEGFEEEEEMKAAGSGGKVLGEVQNLDSSSILQIMICSVCLGERSDAHNEIIECDKCGVTVHEGCYGVQDGDSVCSSDSPTPTTPWFCDACKAGVEDPDCELCPNKGGIFKETDVGKWTHLVCALYMPGVAFADVDRLSSVTLFEMSYTKWGHKPCSLCKDRRFAGTGVPVSCDAGLCKTYFHVTCGQREGLLSEAHSEEADQADPYYAHCRLHSDKNLVRRRKRNWLALSTRMDEIRKHKKPHLELDRIERRLAKYRAKYRNSRSAKPLPWVPTQKMGRLLTTSASACRKLWHKAELSGTDMHALELKQTQMELLQDVHRRWHVQPAFSLEFVAYFLDRNGRIDKLRNRLSELAEENAKLVTEQTAAQNKRDSAIRRDRDEGDKNKELKAAIRPYHELLIWGGAPGTLPDLDLLGQPVLYPPSRLGGQEPSETTTEEGSALSNTCGICVGSHDQHLLTKCDTCNKYYHLACLDPPLLRMPKKTKLVGWQCSDCCDSADSSSATGDPGSAEAPRKLRRRDSFEEEIEDGSAAGKKRPRWEMHHHRYSPEPPPRKHHKKHKHGKSPRTPSSAAVVDHRQSLKICFKSIPHPTGEGSSYVATPSGDLTTTPVASPPALLPRPQQPQTHTKPEQAIICINCKRPGTSVDLVRCDECLHGFHFACLDPPVKKSPKVKGYSWHCANCDPTDSDD